MAIWWGSDALDGRERKVAMYKYVAYVVVAVSWAGWRICESPTCHRFATMELAQEKANQMNSRKEVGVAHYVVSPYVMMA